MISAINEQQTQLSLTNRATHLCKYTGVADLLNTRPSHMCYHAEIGRPALKAVGINTEPTKLGSSGIPLSWNGSAADLWYTPLPHMCYHFKIGSYATKGLCINRREPQKLRSASAPPPAVGAWLTPRSTLLLYMCYPAEFARSRSNGTSVIKEICLEISSLVSRLSGSLKVIGTDR